MVPFSDVTPFSDAVWKRRLVMRCHLVMRRRSVTAFGDALVTSQHSCWRREGTRLTPQLGLTTRRCQWQRRALRYAPLVTTVSHACGCANVIGVMYKKHSSHNRHYICTLHHAITDEADETRWGETRLYPYSLHWLRPNIRLARIRVQATVTHLASWRGERGSALARSPRGEWQVNSLRSYLCVS